MATSEVIYTNTFEDDTTQDITIGPFATNNAGLARIKSNVIAFNQAFNSDTATLMTSKYGNEWTGISRARIVTTNVTTYF